MQLRISSHSLQEAVNAVSKAYMKDSTRPVLTGVKIDACDGAVTFQATDLTKSVRHVARAIVEEEGTTVASCATLQKVVRGLPDESVAMSTNGMTLHMECRGANYTLNTLDPQDFPEFPEVVPEQSTTIRLQTIESLIDAVAKSASSDNSRPVITGVLVSVADDGVRMVATDSYRMSTAFAACDGTPFDAVVPANDIKSAVCMARDDMVLSSSESQVCMSSGGTTWVTRRIEGRYPDWRQLFPKVHGTEVTFDVHEFSAAMDAVKATTAGNPVVDMTFADDAALLVTRSATEGESRATFPVDIQGDPVTIRLRYDFTVDALAGCNDDGILELTGSMQPAVFRSHGGIEFASLIMPVRL